MSKNSRLIALRLMIVVALTMAGSFSWLVRTAQAQQASPPASHESDAELAKKTQNLVADLINVPFQNNFNFE